MSESSSPDEAAGMAPVVQLGGSDEDSVAIENTQEVQTPIEDAVEDKDAIQIDNNDEDYAPPILESEASEKVDIDMSPKSIASNDDIIEIHDKVSIEPDTDIDADVSMNESILASPRSFSTEDEETPSLSVQYIKSKADGSVTQIPCFVKLSTPIPNSDSSLRLLRKFISKTSKYFPVSCGGTKPSSRDWKIFRCF